MDRWVAKLRDGVAKYRQNGDQRDKWVAKQRDRWLSSNNIELGTKIEKWLTEC